LPKDIEILSFGSLREAVEKGLGGKITE
jgi:hypothetical protein